MTDEARRSYLQKVRRASSSADLADPGHTELGDADERYLSAMREIAEWGRYAEVETFMKSEVPWLLAELVRLRHADSILRRLAATGFNVERLCADDDGEVAYVRSVTSETEEPQ